jgi:hypothetical protein
MRATLILLLISLSACTSHGVISTADNLQPAVSTPSVMINYIQTKRYSLPRDAHYKLQECLDFAVRTMQVGETCRWDYEKAVGFVKLVKIDSRQCHIMYNTLYYKKKPKYWQTTACWSTGAGKWLFS